MANVPNRVRRPELRAVLFIEGFASSPTEITALLGVSPSHVVERGKPTRFGPPGNLGKTMSWSLATAKSDATGLDALVTSLLSHFDACWPKLVTICTGVHVELLCEVWFEDDATNLTFDLGFSAEIVRKLAELGASIGFDVYPGK